MLVDVLMFCCFYSITIVIVIVIVYRFFWCFYLITIVIVIVMSLSKVFGPNRSTGRFKTQHYYPTYSSHPSQILYMGGYVAGARDDGLDVVNLMHGRDDVPGMEV